VEGDQIYPTITGQAWLNADSTFLLDPGDPFCWGIG
jgi:proline racemase